MREESPPCFQPPNREIRNSEIREIRREIRDELTPSAWVSSLGRHTLAADHPYFRVISSRIIRPESPEGHNAGRRAIRGENLSRASMVIEAFHAFGFSDGGYPSVPQMAGHSSSDSPTAKQTGNLPVRPRFPPEISVQFGHNVANCESMSKIGRNDQPPRSNGTKEDPSRGDPTDIPPRHPPKFRVTTGMVPPRSRASASATAL